MMPQIRELDRTTTVAPLGVRFYDELTASVISEGLLVSVYHPGDRQRAIPVHANRSGVFVVHHIDGLRAFEHGAAGPSTTTNVVLEVADTQGRFQPFTLQTSAPQPGLIAAALSPLAGRTWIPLFSAATRAVTAGVGVIRAQLYDPTRTAPAAWAVLEVDVAGQPPVRAVADEQGSIAIMFPYPTPPVTPLGPGGSPLSPLSASFTEQVWHVGVRARYGGLQPPTGVPDLDDVLAQPPAMLWADLAHTRALTDALLQFGRETVLRTQDDSGLTRPSVLLVQAASPL